MSRMLTTRAPFEGGLIGLFDILKSFEFNTLPRQPLRTTETTITRDRTVEKVP